MTTGTMKMGGRKFWIVGDKDYKVMVAAIKAQERQARIDAGDVAESRRRMAERGGKTLAQVRQRLGV